MLKNTFFSLYFNENMWGTVCIPIKMMVLDVAIAARTGSIVLIGISHLWFNSWTTEVYLHGASPRLGMLDWLKPLI